MTDILMGSISKVFCDSEHLIICKLDYQSWWCGDQAGLLLMPVKLIVLYLNNSVNLAIGKTTTRNLLH